MTVLLLTILLTKIVHLKEARIEQLVPATASPASLQLPVGWSQQYGARKKQECLQKFPSLRANWLLAGTNCCKLQRFDLSLENSSPQRMADGQFTKAQAFADIHMHTPSSKADQILGCLVHPGYCRRNAKFPFPLLVSFQSVSALSGLTECIPE